MIKKTKTQFGKYSGNLPRHFFAQSLNYRRDLDARKRTENQKTMIYIYIYIYIILKNNENMK